MPSVQNNTTHPVLTQRRGLTYEFTTKHHGGNPTASCWLTALTLIEEFGFFDRADGIQANPPADDRQVSDPQGNLYGYQALTGGGQRLSELGTWHQQMAEFPVQLPGAVWHGYPIWPIAPHAPQKYQGQKCRPDAQVFARMVQLGDITAGERKRLMRGDWI